MLRSVTLLIAVALGLGGCAASTDEDAATPTEGGGPQTSEQPTVLGGAPRQEQSVAAAAGRSRPVPIMAVGDIAACSSDGDEKVAALAAARTGRIALLGDVVYPDGTPQQFAECFDPAWGPMAGRLRPALGNHEYHTANARPYWDYFGDWSGRRGQGWYAYNLGEHWRAIVLNTNCANIGGCTMDSPQGRWLNAAIENAGDRHIIAYWHQPLYSTGKHGPTAAVRPFYRALYRARAAIVLNGHDHSYERFAPQNHRGDRRRLGIQQFVVGTGGYRSYRFGSRPHPNTMVRDNTTFGLLRLWLGANGYSWKFIPAVGDFTDSGSRTLD